jgi:putative hemolysin
MRVQLATQREFAKTGPKRLSVTLATNPGDVEAAQRLRYRVFAGELGARIDTRTPDRDHDMFDPWCEHLIVRDNQTDEVIGTYRILTADRAKRIGAYYADLHFDLVRLARLKPDMMEIGRACIHPDYRTGAAIMLLWQGLAQLMSERGVAYLIGCVSIGMADGGANAARVFERVAPRHLAPSEYRVRPRNALMPRDGTRPEVEGVVPLLPPILKGYLRVGAWIGGEPSWDPDFNTADLLLFLPVARIAARYARHYLHRAA